LCFGQIPRWESKFLGKVRTPPPQKNTQWGGVGIILGCAGGGRDSGGEGHTRGGWWGLKKSKEQNGLYDKRFVCGLLGCELHTTGGN